MRYNAFIVLAFLIVTPILKAQNKDLDRLEKSELRMTLPSIYFKHNSTEYTSMPYQVDSCFRYIAKHINDINDLVIWRDTLETEKLTTQRIRKLKAELSKRKVTGIQIQSMREQQKISRYTINTSTDSAQKNYLLSLNSVFEVARTQTPNETSKSFSHLLRPRISCWDCWRTGFHMGKSGRMYRKMYRQRKQDQQDPERKEKHRRRLVWTGWKTGFHWSDPR